MNQSIQNKIMGSVALITALLVSAPRIHAQESSFSIPEPIQDAIDTAKRIHIDTNAFKWRDNFLQWQGKYGFQDDAEAGLKTELREFWSSANNWLYTTIGVTFVEIIKTIGSVIIWIFQTMIKLLQRGIEML